MAQEGRFILRELCRYKIGTFADIILRNALLRPNEEAFVYGKERITFRQYNQRVNSLIHALRDKGVRKGEVVGALSWNCLEYADVYGTCQKGGLIASPFNPRLSSEELEYLVNDSGAVALFVGPELVEMANSLRPKIPQVKHFISLERPAPGMEFHAELLDRYPGDEPDVQVEEDDPVCIFYTSGTTGAPRGALYTHRRSMENTRSMIIEIALEPGDKNLQIMPFFHVGGAAWWMAFFFIGGCNVILKQFDPAATLHAIQAEKATDIHIVPTHLVAMLALPDFDKYDISSLKRMFYAASPMPVELLKRAMKVWGPIFFQGYGQTESGPTISFLRKESHKVLDKSAEEQTILSSCGRLAVGVQGRIVDDKGDDVPPGEVGEIKVRSKQIMVEYWHKPVETAGAIEEGWLQTGDMGYYDENGYIYIVDRKKDMIISGGENIYPREVEEVLYRHRAVLEATVFGIPDPVWVESVHAVVTLRQGARATPEEIIVFCKENLARYKAPKSVEFADSLPKNPAGKILKRELREKYWAGMGRSI